MFETKFRIQHTKTSSWPLASLETLRTSTMLALLFVALIAGGSYGQNVRTADVAIFGNSCTFTSSFDIVGQNICSPGVQAGCYVLVDCAGDSSDPTSLTMTIYDNPDCSGNPLYPSNTITPGSC